MSVLKTLKLVAAPVRSSRDKVEDRRFNMIQRLEDQKKLLADPTYVRKSTHFTGKGEERRRVEKEHRVKKWWSEDSSGVVTMSMYRAGKPIEFAPDRAAVAAASLKDLLTLMDRLIEATRSGELDEHLAKATKTFKKKVAKAA
jgi:hypothetical protein